MKIISEIKVKTKTLKDRRKNVRKLIDCFKGNIEPDCYFLCKNFNNYKNSDYQVQAHWYAKLCVEYLDLTKEIDTMGKAILFLRGNKWSF